MTGGLSFVLQPLSNDISPPNSSQLPFHGVKISTTSNEPPTTTSTAAYVSSGTRTPPFSVLHSTYPRDSEFTASAGTVTSRNNRLSLAAVAREKTTSALANFSLRPKTSSHSLHSSYSSTGSFSKQGIFFGERNPIGTDYTIVSSSRSEKENIRKASLPPPEPESRPPKPRLSQRTIQAIAPPGYRRFKVPEIRNTPPVPGTKSQTLTKAQAQIAKNKMHQTSSRLLRMTDEERPFTRDFEDLFSTLMVSLPLSSHRIRFQRIEHTFTSEEAINNLGSLKFSQSNRMPDPKDPSRIVTTTTTTTFSMAKEMARSVCQRFMDARFIETADGKLVPAFPLKNAVWQLTPKGMHVLTRFCQRNGINQRHVLEVLDSYRNTMQLVILERDGTTDKLSHDRATIEVIFRRFAGQGGPNIKLSTANSDSDSLSDYYNGLVGVKMAKDRKIQDRIVQNTFTGKAAVDWLMDCCTTVDRREVYEIADLFVQYALIWAVLDDKVYANQNPAAARFQPTKASIFALTDKGQRIAGWVTREDSVSGDETRSETSKGSKSTKNGKHPPRETNNHRLNIIVNDPALRLLFREFLRDTHCEENLAFYLEVREFTRSYDIAERAKAFARLDAIRESLAAAYGLPPSLVSN